MREKLLSTRFYFFKTKVNNKRWMMNLQIILRAIWMKLFNASNNTVFGSGGEKMTQGRQISHRFFLHWKIKKKERVKDVRL